MLSKQKKEEYPIRENHLHEAGKLLDYPEKLVNQVFYLLGINYWSEAERFSIFGWIDLI